MKPFQTKGLQTKALKIAAYIFRKSPRFKGKGRAAEFIGSLLTPGADPIVSCKMAAGHRLQLDCRVQSHCRAYFSGEYDDVKISTLLSFLRKNGAVLDIGANIGFYTVPMARKAERLNATVSAFEPVQSNCEWLLENLLLNACKDVVQIWPCALSDTDGEASIVLAEDFQAGGIVGNAVIADENAYGTQFGRAIAKLKRLDDIWPKVAARIDIIKVDTEGHEAAFLRGSRNTLSTYRPVILMEVNRWHYRRQAIDFDSLIPKLLPTEYQFVKITSGGLRHLASLADCDDDDVMLIPRERLT
jgi:FkbM family methyltransferase